MAANGLNRQPDIEDLSAWMDGELASDGSRRVAELVREDPDWQATHRQFLALDAALGRLEAPAAEPDLTDRILAATHRPGVARRLLRALVPLAAAAAIVLAVTIFAGRTKPPASVQEVIAHALRDVPKDDRLMVEQLGLFQNYRDVVAYEQVRSVIDGETLTALARLEAQEAM